MNEKLKIYDELSRVLTDYETGAYGDHKVNENDLYLMLVKIQSNWESIITAEEC